MEMGNRVKTTQCILDLFCNPALGARSQALVVAKAKVFPHLDAWEYRI
jgi:hypothetical protein